MSRSSFCVIVLLSFCLSGFVSTASGMEDMRPAPWRGLYPSEMTLQAWTFDSPADPTTPELDANPFGTAIADISLGLFNEGWFDLLPGYGTQDGFWDIGGSGGSIVLNIDNSPAPNDYKDIYLQITYYEDLHQAPTAEVPGGYLVEELCERGIIVERVPTGGNWMLDLLVFRIEPNPADEQIIIRSDPDWGSMIDEVVVDTWCVPPPANIEDVYWDHVNSSVVLVFNSVVGVNYTIETAQGDAYASDLVWSNLTTVTATATETTITDDLSTNPLSHAFRFYRVRRTIGSGYSRQTAAVFELPVTASPATPLYFISTPLIPDPDHDSVRQIFGEGAARQVPRSGFQVSDLDEAVGAISRMRYLTGLTAFTVVAGAEFDIEAGAGYEMLMGAGFPVAYKLRLTGYVPETAQTVPLTKVGAQSIRWMAYSLPRPIALNDLGLPAAVTPIWNSLNRIRVLPLGSAAWVNYQYNVGGGYWYNIYSPATPVNPNFDCGTGIVFIRGGFPNATDQLVLPTWYTDPPNDY